MDKTDRQVEADAKLIDQLGGPTKLAELLKYGTGGVQRITNWKRRGIPPAVKVQHPQLFLRAELKAA